MDSKEATRAVNALIWARDEIAKLEEEYKAKKAPYEEIKNAATGELLAFLDKSGFQNVKTEAGTIYKSRKHKATVQDADEFRGFVLATGRLDLLENRASEAAVKAYIEEFKEPPPGVKFDTVVTLRTERITGREYKLA